MRAIYCQFSAIAGLLALLNQYWNSVPFERASIIGSATTLVVFLLLIFGDVTIQRLIAQVPPVTATASAEKNGKARSDSADAKAA